MVSTDLKKNKNSSCWQRKSEIVIYPSIKFFQIHSPPEQVSSSNTHEWTNAEQLCASLWFGMRNSFSFSLSLLPQSPQVFPFIHEATVTCKIAHLCSERWSVGLSHQQGTRQKESSNIQSQCSTLRFTPSKVTFFSPSAGTSTVTVLPFL